MAEDLILEKAQDRLIDLINESSGGRLVITKSRDGDADLAVEKRSDYSKNPIFLKIFVKNDKPDLSEPKDNFYVIEAHFDIVKQDIDDLIFVSGQKMDKRDLGKFLLNKFGK